MLHDFRKMVGFKTAAEVKATRYAQQVGESPAAEQLLELGGLHRKTGDTQAAIAAFSNAARLAANDQDVTIAMAANKAIVQLEPDHKDALANLAYIRFRHGSDVVNREYEDLLCELESRRRRAHDAQVFGRSGKNLPGRAAPPDDDDPAFEIERQACSEGPDADCGDADSLALTAAWQIDRLVDSSLSAGESTAGAQQAGATTLEVSHPFFTPAFCVACKRIVGAATTDLIYSPPSFCSSTNFVPLRLSVQRPNICLTCIKEYRHHISII